MFDKLQKHTVDIYELEKKEYELFKCSAKSLLDVRRFDLFAKLFYARNKLENYKLASYVYDEHIKAFNPDLKEPGRTDKNSLDDFRNVFDTLLNTFKKETFNEDISLIPLAANGMILDGAHRVASLAFENKEVSCVKFKDVCPKAKFDYKYFLNRGLPFDVANWTVLEMGQWVSNLYVACIWPKVADKTIAFDYLKSKFNIAYDFTIKVSLKSMVNFVQKIYASQSWTKKPASVEDKAMQCFGFKKELLLVFFKADSLQDVVFAKEEIRKKYGMEKHALHITDCIEETNMIANLVLNEETRQSWCVDETTVRKFKNKIAERWLYFKKVEWINFKVFVARCIGYKK